MLVVLFNLNYCDRTIKYITIHNNFWISLAIESFHLATFDKMVLPIYDKLDPIQWGETKNLKI